MSRRFSKVNVLRSMIVIKPRPARFVLEQHSRLIYSLDMEKEVQNWLASAEYDLETAGSMFGSGRYIYTVFMCHLAIEKLTKAVIAQEAKTEPPRSHDLQCLLGLTSSKPDGETKEFVAELSNLSVATRYPVDFERALSDFSKERANTLLKRTKETF